MTMTLAMPDGADDQGDTAEPEYASCAVGATEMTSGTRRIMGAAAGSAASLSPPRLSTFTTVSRLVPSRSI